MCTCNGITHIQVKTCMFLLKCLHVIDENMTHPIPCPESSPTPSHMYMPSVKTKPSLCSINGHFFFQNKSFLFYKSKSIGRFPISTCISQVSCVYAFVGHGFSGLHRRTPHAFPPFLRGFHHRLSCLTSIPGLSPLREKGGGGGGGGGGYLFQFAMPNTYIFHFQNRATHFGHCPMLPSPASNTKHNVDQPCTHNIPSNTKHSVDLYHALTPMSCDVLVHNAMQSCHCSFIPCYIYDECYMCMPTHA